MAHQNLCSIRHACSYTVYVKSTLQYNLQALDFFVYIAQWPRYYWSTQRNSKGIVINKTTVKSRVLTRVTIPKIKSLGVLQFETCH